MGWERHGTLTSGIRPSFFYTPTWSPDSKKIAYTDKRLQLWYLDLDKADAEAGGHTITLAASGRRSSARRWSPDNKWIAYSKQLPSGQHAIFVYSLEQGKSFRSPTG